MKEETMIITSNFFVWEPICRLAGWGTRWALLRMNTVQTHEYLLSLWEKTFSTVFLAELLFCNLMNCICDFHQVLVKLSCGTKTKLLLVISVRESKSDRWASLLSPWKQGRDLRMVSPGDMKDEGLPVEVRVKTTETIRSPLRLSSLENEWIN